MNMFTKTEEEKRRSEKRKAEAQSRSDLAAALGYDLLEALNIGAGQGQEDLTPDQIRTLQKQILALDKVFQRLLSDADNKYDMLLQYSVALRAQNQYRYTVEALNSLKKEEEEDAEK